MSTMKNTFLQRLPFLRWSGPTLCQNAWAELGLS